MSDERGFFAELIHRRVPQYLGLYIAGVWLSIEIGDWIKDQFTLPLHLTAYLFVFLAVLLPSVALIAWTHGAPGKDQSTRAERIFVPINVVLAVVAVFLMPARAPGPAPVADPTVAAVAPPEPAPAAARRGNSQRLLAFFFRNNTSDAPDWLAYGIPFMLGEDMERASVGFVVRTPFGSIVERLRQSGFERAVNEPQSIQLDTARGAQYRYFLRGEVSDADSGEGLLLKYALHESSSGSKLLEDAIPFTEQSVFDATDQVSAKIQQALLDGFDDRPVLTDLPLDESFTGSVAAARHYVEALIASNIDNDIATAISLSEQAIEQDPQFAEALAWMGTRMYLQGRNDQAIAMMDEALKYDFRLSRGSGFLLRMNRQAVEFNYPEAINIARKWTEVEPNNESAFKQLARLNEVSSQDLNEALRSLEQVREINPAANETLLQSANIELQRGNFAAAESFAEQYAGLFPDSVRAANVLAQAKAASGDLNGAFDAYQQASYLDSRSIEPQLGMVSMLMRRGDFADAEDRLESLASRNGLTGQQQLQVASSQVQLYGFVGQYSEVVATLDRYDEIAQQLMQPLLYAIQWNAPRIMMQAFYDTDYASHIASMDELRSTMQPPWNDFLYSYDLSVHSLAKDKEGYAVALDRAERFLANQSNASLDVIRYTSRAQGAVFSGDRELAMTNIQLALQSTEESLLNVLAAAETLGIRANMYDLLRRIGEPRAAIEGLLDVVSRFPGLAVAHLRLAQAYVDVGDFDAARSAAQTAGDIWRDADENYKFLEELREVDSAIASGA
ncbi:MAG: tetratricopeptide repeat protein [Pseudomonadota bacterium]